MQTLPSLKSLQFFWVAAQQKSFKLAAEQLFVTQAAVSQQIRLLEGYLGVELFVRSVKQTLLTREGQQLFPHIDLAFKEMQLGVQKVSGDMRPNILRITALHSFTSSWLIEHLPNFQAQFPELMVQLMPSNELVNFQQTEVDLAIRMGRGGYAGVQEKQIMTDQLVLVASPLALAKIDKSQAAEVFKLPIIYDTSPAFPEAYQACAEHFGVNIDGCRLSIQSDNAMPLIDHALAGQGLLLTNQCLVERHLRHKTLEVVLDYRVVSPYSLYLVAPEHHFSFAKVKAFEQWFVPTVTKSFKHD
ncbi:LysR substrate-binding domain-containing protein [Paraglaciecola aestuariivivens]